jgi:hypothetical protein
MKYRITSVPGLNKYIIEKRFGYVLWIPAESIVYNTYEEAEEALKVLS